jgi:DNA-binding NarL/FixJ family response regulator
MSYIDLCLIADHNADRRQGLKDMILTHKMSKEIVHSINCGHGLLYLNQWVEKVAGKQIVVILNSKTPMMGGVEFFRELKKGEMKFHVDKVKIIVMTDGLTTEDKKEFNAYGITDFLDCDLANDELESQLKNLFKKPRVKRATAENTRMKKIVNTTVNSFHDLESKHVYMVPNTHVG